MACQSAEDPSSLFLVRIPLRHRIFAYLSLVRRKLIWLAATRRLSYPRLARSHWRVPKLLVSTLVNPWSEWVTNDGSPLTEIMPVPSVTNPAARLHSLVATSH